MAKNVRSELRILLVIVVAGLVFRLNPLTAILPLFDDEAFTFAVIVAPFPSGVIELTAGDVHPPLYYLAMAGWIRVFGTSPLALRVPSVLLGTGAIALSWWFSRLWCAAEKQPDEMSFRVAPLLLAAGVAASPPLISVSYFARMYALLTVQTLLMVGCAFLCLRTPTRRGPWILVTLLGISACYTHNYGLFLVVSVVAWLLLESFFLPPEKRWRVAAYGLAMGAIAAVAYGPWISVLTNQAQDVAQNYWTRPLEFRSVLTPVAQFFGPPSSYISQSSLVFVVVGSLATILALWPWRSSAAHRLALVFFGCHGVLLLVAEFFLDRSVLAPRYVIHLFPIVLAPICYWLARIPDALVAKCVWGWLGVLMLSTAAFLLMEVIPLRDVMPRTARFVHEQLPEDAILLAAHERLYIHLQYYLARGAADPVDLRMIGELAPQGHTIFGACIPRSRRTKLEAAELDVGRPLWVVRYSRQSLPNVFTAVANFHLESLSEHGVIVLSRCDYKGSKPDVSEQATADSIETGVPLP